MSKKPCNHRNKRKKFKKKPELSPSKEVNYFVPFDEVNLDEIQRRYGFKTIKLVGDIIYVTTNNGEEYFIEGVWNSDIEDCISKLHHKNTKFNRDKYHEELKYFANIFMIFGYIKHHEHKPFDNTKSPQIREMEKMKRLFTMI